MTYKIENGEVIITDCYPTAAGKLVILAAILFAIIIPLYNTKLSVISQLYTNRLYEEL